MLLIVATLIVVVLILLLIAANMDWLHHLQKLGMLVRSDAASVNLPVDTPASLVVSIIIPARNEARNIARCLDGVLSQQTQLNYEIIVVDDGSTDDTPTILADYAKRKPHRIRVLQGRPLQPGWVGKCNACQHGAEAAQGEWLLFLDADTEASPQLIESMLDLARYDQLDALSIMPFNQLVSLSERVVLPIFWFFAFTVFPGLRGHKPEIKPAQAMAVGQCFMFKARVYYALGGHAAVSDKVLEDVEFAQVLRASGYRLGMSTGFDEIRVRMYHNFDEVALGLMKHARAGLHLSGWRGYWAIFSTVAVSILPLVLLIARLLQWQLGQFDPVFGIAVLSSIVCYVASLQLWAQVYAKLFKLSALHAFMAPFGMVAYLAIALMGILRVTFKRGIIWKGRVYEANTSG